MLIEDRIYFVLADRKKFDIGVRHGRPAVRLVVQYRHFTEGVTDPANSNNPFVDVDVDGTTKHDKYITAPLSFMKNRLSRLKLDKIPTMQNIGDTIGFEAVENFYALGVSFIFFRMAHVPAATPSIGRTHAIRYSMNP